MDLSIIIPAYNEGKKIEATLKSVAFYLKTKPIWADVIVINDGSRDETKHICESVMPQLASQEVSYCLLSNDRNRGKGYSIKKGVSQAQGEYILYSDADLSTPIEEMEKFLPFLKDKYDIVLGSRALKESQILVHQPWYREKMGKVFNLLVRTLVLRGIKDTQCGFKCFRKEAAKKIFAQLVTDGFAFDVEALVLAKKMNFKVKEVPIKWVNHPESKVHPVKHSLAMLLELMKIRLKSSRQAFWSTYLAR